jgi:hypothetical protein
MAELTDDQLDGLISAIGLGKNRPGPKPSAPCGTLSAYQRHFRKGEPIDDACREANARWKADQFKQPVKNPNRLKPIAHGTPKGYKQHAYRRETPCAACREANRLDCAARSRARKERAA